MIFIDMSHTQKNATFWRITDTFSAGYGYISICMHLLNFWNLTSIKCVFLSYAKQEAQFSTLQNETTTCWGFQRYCHFHSTFLPKIYLHLVQTYNYYFEQHINHQGLTAHQMIVLVSWK